MPLLDAFDTPVLMKGFFITGTDTGVGKTMLAAWITAFMRSKNMDAMPMKPVQTGCEMLNGRRISQDLEFCLSAGGVRPGNGIRSYMTPYCFKMAASPHLAARVEGKAIRLSVIMRAFKKLAAVHETLIVEGAGGLLVPLNSRTTMLDLIKHMKLPVLVAARPGLGTLNHTLMSLNELQRAECSTAGIVIVESAAPGRNMIEKDNRATLRSFSKTPVLGRIKYMDSPDPAGVLTFADQALKSNLERLLKSDFN